MLKGFIKKAAHRLGYAISRNDDLDAFYPLLHYHFVRTPSFFFVQIGANDGKMLDPLYGFVRKHRDRIEGVALEPLADMYERLVQTYADLPRIRPVNMAIHATEHEMDIWRVAPEHAGKVAQWASGMGSFDRNHHRHLHIPTEYMISEKVRCLTFDELLRQYAISKIDLLQIDTEGYDAEILLSLRYDRIRPTLIHFEHGLHEGIMNSETFNCVAEQLHRNGYELSIGRHDATAYLRTLFVPTSEVERDRSQQSGGSPR